MSSVMEA